MKLRHLQWALAFLMLLAFKASAATLYVSLTSTNPVPPYTNWSTAATNIQDAIDASTNGDLVLVTNGVYSTGGRRWYDSGTNRVTLTNAIILQSVNGPAVTLIVGSHVAGAGLALTNAVRCVGIGNNAVLSGFSLFNGEAGWGNYPAGGGVANLVSISTAGTVTNCVLIGNLATNAAGGGAYRVRLINCKLTGNSATYGGGACACALVNCTVVSNTASSGGGVYGDTTFGASALANCTIVANLASGSGGGVNNENAGAMDNCIVYYNTAPSGSNYTGIKMNYCCTMPTLNGDSTSFTNEPLFVNLAGGNFHLQSNSPCINSGNNAYVTGAMDLDGNPRIAGGTVDMGAYEFQGNIRYVSLSSTNPIAPYSDWSVAATNIQDAIDASTNGNLILVTNGVYQTGGRTVYGSLINRVVIDKAVTVQSVNGPAVTVIQGYQVPATTNGPGAVRCVYLTNNAALIGFTLTNGATLSTGDNLKERSGGGVWCEPNLGIPNAIISNCVLSVNSASLYGGGALCGTLINSELIGNSASYGGGACSTPNNGVTYFNVFLDNCLVIHNSAAYGGAVATADFSLVILNNCVVYGNSASVQGGGLFGYGFGAPSYVQSTNCIIVGNGAPAGSNYYSPFAYMSFNYCCTAPLPASGVGNFANDPLFVNPAADDFHLQSNSPCINAGNNACVTTGTDLDGNPRIVGGTVDIGAYEYQMPVSKISYAWLQQYDLPITTNTDAADPDNDKMNNYQEWIAGTDPTNPLSLLEMLNPIPTNNPTGLLLSWQSVSNRTYFLQSSVNLGAQPAFSTIQSNIVGQQYITSFMDTNAVGNGPFFYRVGVQ